MTEGSGKSSRVNLVSNFNVFFLKIANNYCCFRTWMPYSVEIWNCRDTVDTSLPVCVFTFHVQAALTLLNSSDSLGMWQIWQQATTCQQGPNISETDYTAKREPDMFTLEKIHTTVQYRYTSFSVLSPSCLSSISDCLTCQRKGILHTWCQTGMLGHFILVAPRHQWRLWWMGI